MNDEVPFQLSQGFEVLRPKSSRAYPIPCNEWSLLKGKIGKLTTEPWFFHTFGALLIGAALSTFVAILIGTFQLPAQQRQLDIAWGIVVVTLICGIVSIIFAHKERGVFRERANDVVAQMELIETRYDNSSD